MKYENVLPEGFPGTFYFTNDSDEEFIGKWGNKEYHFGPNSMSPMVIPNQTLYEIQYIRKKFAKDWAEREFFKTPIYEKLRLREGVRDELGMIQPRANGMSHAGTYSDKDLIPLIQRCLKPLPVGKTMVAITQEEPLEEKLSRDNSGELNSIVVPEGGDIIETKRSLASKAKIK